MHRRNNSNSFLRRQATRKPEHLRPICLHWKIPQRTSVHFSFHMNTPTEDCPKTALCQCKIERSIRPSPEVGVSAAMHLEQLSRSEEHTSAIQSLSRI